MRPRIVFVGILIPVVGVLAVVTLAGSTRDAPKPGVRPVPVRSSQQVNAGELIASLKENDPEGYERLQKMGVLERLEASLVDKNRSDFSFDFFETHEGRHLFTVIEKDNTLVLTVHVRDQEGMYDRAAKAIITPEASEIVSLDEVAIARLVGVTDASGEILGGVAQEGDGDVDCEWNPEGTKFCCGYSNGEEEGNGNGECTICWCFPHRGPVSKCVDDCGDEEQ